MATQSKVAEPDQKKVELSDEDKERGVTARSEPVDVPEEKEETERQKKSRERAEKAAEVQAEQDDADIEAFLAAQRGERLLRGADGSYDHIAFESLKRDERLAAAREGADEDDLNAEADAQAEEDARVETSRLKSEDLGGKDATRRH